MRIHHIGYLVKKMDKALAAFLDLGYVVTKDVVLDEFRQIDICFIEKDGYLIELVSPVSRESVVYALMKKIGNAPYHVCYETDTFEEDAKALLNQKYILCNEMHEAAALDGRKVCFFVHPYLGMIELAETRP